MNDRKLRETGTVDLSPLRNQWLALDQTAERADEAIERWRLPQLVARSFDESQVAGHRVTFSLLRSLRVADEHHEAFKVLISNFGVRHWAHWSLLRPQFEAAFWMLWILDPADGRERRRRGLRREALDFKEHRSWMMAHVPAGADADLLQQADYGTFANSDKEYSDEAKALHIPRSMLYTRINVVAELAKLNFERHGLGSKYGHYMVTVWRRLSGAEHGFSYALLQSTDRADPRPIAGGTSVFLSPNDEDLINYCKFVATLHLLALQRFIEWHTAATLT